MNPGAVPGQAHLDRSARDVLDDHLSLAQDGEVEEDLRRNYHADVRILGPWGVRRGHDGARELAERLRRELPGARFTYTTRVVDGDAAFLEWRAEADGARVDDGADSFWFRDGRVAVQAIHYTVRDG